MADEDGKLGPKLDQDGNKLAGEQTPFLPQALGLGDNCHRACSMDCIERGIRSLSTRTGRCISRYFWLCIIIPVIFAAVVFGCGFTFMEHKANVEYLFTPQDSQARKHQSRLHDDFSDVKDYSPSRSLDVDLVLRVIISHTTNNSIWNQESLEEIYELDDDIRAIKADDKDFEAICKTSSGSCLPNGLDLVRRSQSRHTSRNLKFPVHDELPEGPGLEQRSVFLGYLLGGVTTQDDDITDVQAMQLVYYLNKTDEGRAWADEVITELDNHTFKHIKVDKWQFYSIEQELVANTKRIIPYLGITFTVLIVSSICATFVLDQVRSKPLLGVCGVISAVLSIVSALGLLMIFRLPLVDVVAAAPFLAPGIAVYNMFVMLAAWRKTDHYKNTEDRMAETFSEVAMPITTTSVKNILAVGIGAITPFPAVRIFCGYMGLMLVMCYVFQMTFFAGCMALSGKREEANRHVWLICKKIPAKSELEQGRGKCYLMCCAGGVSRANRNEKLDNTEVFMMKFFRDHFSRVINHIVGKVVIIILTVVYLSVAIWGCTTINQGLELKNLAPDDSYVADFYQAEEQYFSEYDFQVQVVIHTPINSTEKASRVHDLIAELEQTEFFRGPKFTKSWLRDYEKYAEIYGYNIDYSNIFDSRFDRFLNEQPAFREYADDVLENGDVYRFIVMSDIPVGTKGEMDMMHQSRMTAEKYEDLDVVVYSPRFIFTEQYVEVLPNTLQNLIFIAVVSILLVAILLILHRPMLVCRLEVVCRLVVLCLLVVLYIISICVGVVGFMAFWNVSLDIISMISLIMCIGFCTDFSVHITYAFVTSKKASRPDRVSDTLYALGFPILQGSMSTILAVLPLYFSSSYIFCSFFKVMFLAILFGTLYGLFILPVLLSWLGPKGRKRDGPEGIEMDEQKKEDEQVLKETKIPPAPVDV